MGSDTARLRRRGRQRLQIGNEAALAPDAVNRHYGMVPRLQPEASDRCAVDRRFVVQVSSEPVTKTANGDGKS